MPKLKNYFQHNWVRALLLLLFLVLLWQLEDFPSIVEKYYTGTFYKAISDVQHLLLSWLPFSFGDVVYTVIVLAIIFALVNAFALLIKGSFKALAGHLLKVIIGAEAAVLMFYIFWGINYYRPPAAQLLQLTDTTYSLADVKTVTHMIIDSANAERGKITIADLTQSNDSIHLKAVAAIKSLNPLSAKYDVFMPGVKSSLYSGLLNYLGTSGYFNPFTGEAQVNSNMPLFERPFTSCHELSHQIGFAHEDEANFVGYLAATRSKDRLMRYSAYYEATLEFMHYLRRRDTLAHRELKALISKGVKEDIKTDSIYWTKYQGPLGDISNRFYDSFLKANKQPLGLRTYNRMILLTMAWYKKQGYHH